MVDVTKAYKEWVRKGNDDQFLEKVEELQLVKLY